MYTPYIQKKNKKPLNPHKILADLVMGFHLLWIMVIVTGTPIQLFSRKFRFLFRLMLIITLLGQLLGKGKCPLTEAESRLRQKYDPNDQKYEGTDFTNYYSKRILGIEVPPAAITGTLLGITFLTWR